MSRYFWKNINILTTLNKKCLFHKTENYINISRLSPKVTNCSCSFHRKYSTSNNQVEKEENALKGGQVRGATGGKYDIFRDDDSPIILDVDEEKDLYKEHPDLFVTTREKVDEFEGMNLEVGETGVYDIEELVDILRQQNVVNIFVITIPLEYHYVDYMVICSPLSVKHMLSVAEYVRRLYKRKFKQNKFIPCIEGKTSLEWMALDLGNIALHIMSRKARLRYDLETLWTVGSEYDTRLNQEEDALIALLEKHTSLAGFIPADEETVETEDNTDKNKEECCN